MDRAYFDVGWIKADDGSLVGISLGYDRTSHHEWGIAQMMAVLGVKLPKYPMGVTDRQVNLAPGSLHFHEFSVKPRDKRRKAYPAAMLCLFEDGLFEPMTPGAAQSAFNLQFHGEQGDRFYKPEHDLAVSWDRESFGIAVRGEENIQRLRQLHEAFQKNDIGLGLPWARAFFRGGVSFVILSQMPEQAKADVLAQDIAHKELHDAAAATGIEELLKAAGKECYAFSPAWFDDRKDEVIFCINPKKQDKYNGGWFTVAELKDWIEEKGPVIADKRLDAFLKLPENYDWSCRLLQGMQAKGVQPRHHEKVIWFDEAKTIPGLRHRANRATESVLPSGNYAFQDLMDRFAVPLKERAGTVAA